MKTQLDPAPHDHWPQRNLAQPADIACGGPGFLWDRKVRGTEVSDPFFSEAQLTSENLQVMHTAGTQRHFVTTGEVKDTAHSRDSLNVPFLPS